MDTNAPPVTPMTVCAGDQRRGSAGRPVRRPARRRRCGSPPVPAAAAPATGPGSGRAAHRDRAAQRPAAADQPADQLAVAVAHSRRVAAVDVERRARPRTGRHVEHDLPLDRLVPGRSGVPSTSSASTGTNRVAGPPVDRARWTCRNRSSHAERACRRSRSSDALGLRARALGRVDRGVRRRHHHAELPAAAVLRRRGPVRVEHVALVEHRVGDLARTRVEIHGAASSRSARRAAPGRCRPRWAARAGT